MKKSIKISIFSTIGALVLSFATFTTVRAVQFSKLTEATPLTLEDSKSLNRELDSKYPQRNQLLTQLPYSTTPLELNVSAESAILIDMSNGNILYEKNADEIIPPASMTKLFAMYVVDQEVSSGRLHYDDIIYLPPECWACNMPPHSSLMFLGKGQIVTLEELILGLSICSGNDAAYALAYTVCGSMEEFVERMNEVAYNAGLTHTHFVESSGYSEENVTTAREMAAFCRLYLSEHPDSLERFHSVPSFTYPKEKNMAPGDVYGAQDWSNGYTEHITMGITQSNTNPLLGKLEGCDGLKTGYIDESGYNLALTAKRNGTRFLSVTMKGPGRNSSEGQKGRIQDGTLLMETAFSTFGDFTDLQAVKSYFMKVYSSKTKGINLVPAYKPKAVCVPRIYGDSVSQNLDNISVIVELPEELNGQIIKGAQYGQIKIVLGDYTLETIPLIADRNTHKAGFITCFADALIK